MRFDPGKQTGKEDDGQIPRTKPHRGAMQNHIQSKVAKKCEDREMSGYRGEGLSILARPNFASLYFAILPTNLTFFMGFPAKPLRLINSRGDEYSGSRAAFPAGRVFHLV